MIDDLSGRGESAYGKHHEGKTGSPLHDEPESRGNFPRFLKDFAFLGGEGQTSCAVFDDENHRKSYSLFSTRSNGTKYSNPRFRATKSGEFT